MSRQAEFQAERLVQGRKAREMTGASLAERVGVSSASVTNWERGRTSPRDEHYSRLAAALELDEAFLARPIPSSAPKHFRFRSLTAATKRAREAAQVKAQWLHEISEFLHEQLDLPSFDLPELDLPVDPKRLSEEQIEDAAMATRESWGLRDGPIPNVIRLLEAHGVMVARLALNATKLDGLSGWSIDGRPYVVLNVEKASCVRSRFDAAHELGHLVLHRHATLKPESATYKLMEEQAHRFAGSFLFPASAVRDEVVSSSLDAFVRLKRRWKLSVGAQIYRVHQLGLINHHQKVRLQKKMGYRRWRSFEPLDDELTAERPSLIRKAYQLLCDEAGWVPADIIRAVPLGAHDHERLAGLPAGWMVSARDYGQLVRLKAAESSVPPRKAADDGAAKVIAFPERR